MPEPLPIQPRNPLDDRPKRPRSGCLWLLPAALLGVAVVFFWVRDKALHASASTIIRRTLDDQEAAWNRGDLDAFMDGYWRSDDLRFYSGGTVTNGWSPTLERYRKRYQADGREMGQLEFSDLDVQPLAPEAVFVRGRWKVVTSKETFEGLFTLLFRWIDGKWVIVHDHTSAADPPKPQ
jgi:ketosteroid isomerase-like protein